MKYLSYVMMVLCACSLHAQRNISNTDGIVYSTPISVLDVMDMGTTGTITNVAGIGIPNGSKIVFQGTTVNTELYGGGYGDSLTISQGLNVRGTAVNIGALGIVTRGPNYNIANGSASWFGWSDNLDGATGTKDLKLYRDATGTLAQRNGANAQISRIYGTYSNSSNYERLSLSHDGSGVGTIGVESGGSGSADQTMRMRTTGLGAFEVFGDTVPTTARGDYAIAIQPYAVVNRTASGNYSTAIGVNATASGDYSIAAGGTQPVASSLRATAVGGNFPSATGSHSTAVGASYGTASGTYSSIFGGYYASAYLYGQHAYASGRFAANGDAQGSRLVARNTTSGTTPADLFLDGSSARLVLPASTSWGFTVSVVGRTVDNGSGAEQSAYYKFEGLIKRDGANNTTLVGSVTKTVLAEDDSTWDVEVTASDSTESLDITCTGGTGDNTRWVATIQLTEVGG